MNEYEENIVYESFAKSGLLGEGGETIIHCRFNSLLSFIGVHPAGPDHIPGRVRDRVKPVNASLKLLEGEGSRGHKAQGLW